MLLWLTAFSQRNDASVFDVDKSVDKRLYYLWINHSFGVKIFTLTTDFKQKKISHSLVVHGISTKKGPKMGRFSM